jgi:hypothetical protein
VTRLNRNDFCAVVLPVRYTSLFESLRGRVALGSARFDVSDTALRQSRMTARVASSHNGLYIPGDVSRRF